MRTGKSSAVADIASQLGNEGRAVTHTPSDEFQRDLLELDDELDAFETHAIQPIKRGPGRPKGSVDRTTLQLTRFLRAKGYRDPAEFLAAIISQDARALAETLGMESAKDAAELQMRAARELMPYWHQKMPIAVEHKGQTARPLFIINDGAGMGQMLADAMGRMSAFDVEHQALSESDGAASHGEASHDDD